MFPSVSQWSSDSCLFSWRRCNTGAANGSLSTQSMTVWLNVNKSNELSSSSNTQYDSGNAPLPVGAHSVPCSKWCFPVQCGCFTTGRRCCTVKPLSCRLMKGAVHPNLTHKKAELNVVTDHVEPRWRLFWQQRSFYLETIRTHKDPLNTTCFSVCCDLAGCFSADWSWKDKNKVLRLGRLQGRTPSLSEVLCGSGYM